MKQLLQTLWSKDYLTDEHLTGFDNYKVSLTVALPQFIEFHFFFFFATVSVLSGYFTHI